MTPRTRMLEPHKQWFEGCRGIHGLKDGPFFRVSLLQRQSSPLFSPTSPPAAAQFFIQFRGCCSLFFNPQRGRWIHSTCYLLGSCVCVGVRVHFLSSLFSSIILPLSTCWYGRGFIPPGGLEILCASNYTRARVRAHTLPSRLLLTSSFGSASLVFGFHGGLGPSQQDKVLLISCVMFRVFPSLWLNLPLNSVQSEGGR